MTEYARTRANLSSVIEKFSSGAGEFSLNVANWRHFEGYCRIMGPYCEMGRKLQTQIALENLIDDAGVRD